MKEFVECGVYRPHVPLCVGGVDQDLTGTLDVGSSEPTRRHVDHGQLGTTDHARELEEQLSHHFLVGKPGLCDRLEEGLRAP